MVSLDSASQILPIFDALIKYSRELVDYLTPQYKAASTALLEVTDIVYTDISLLKQWQVKLENLDFQKKQESRDNFVNLKQEMQLFKDTPEYHAFRGDCHRIQEIYHDYLQGELKRIFARDRSKLEEADRIFGVLGIADDSMGGLAYFIFRHAEEAIEKIDKNFGDAERIRNEFQNEIRPVKQKVDSQAKELDNLRTKFQHLARASADRL